MGDERLDGEKIKNLGRASSHGGAVLLLRGQPWSHETGTEWRVR